MVMDMKKNGRGRQAGKNSRIPTTLQAVFLASNRGRDVHKPPPEKVAMKTFFRNWLFQRQGGSSSKKMSGGGSGKSMRNGLGFNALAPRNRPGKNKGETAAKNKVSATKSASAQPAATPTLSPQGFLDAMIRSRGYSTRRFKTLQSAYYNKPTALQQASYDVYLIGMVREEDHDGLDKLMGSGISPNPCNTFGESLVHTICRRGCADALDVMLKNGCSLQVADDYGRTPLHDACWAARPAFEVVELILQKDPRLFHMTDCRGAVPLSYVRKEYWGAWIEFLEDNKDRFWPERDMAKDGEQDPPSLTYFGPNTRPIADPDNALTPELAKLVSSGKMKPTEAEFLRYDKSEAETWDESDSDSEYDSDEESSSYDSDDYSVSESELSLDEVEMADILNCIAVPGAKPVDW